MILHEFHSFRRCDLSQDLVTPVGIQVDRVARNATHTYILTYLSSMCVVDTASVSEQLYSYVYLLICTRDVSKISKHLDIATEGGSNRCK